jgi:hypothetical protein
MIYKYLFIVDPSYMQSIKQLRDGNLSVGCMTGLYTRLSVVHALSILDESKSHRKLILILNFSYNLKSFF